MSEFPILIPNALQDLVQDFITSALSERPDNYIDYAVEYHKKLKEASLSDDLSQKRNGQMKRRISPIVNNPKQNASPPLTESTPYGVYQLSENEASIPPGTLLYRTCDLPPPYQASNRAVVFVTDPAISQDVSSLVTTATIAESSKTTNPLPLMSTISSTPPHHKLVLNSLPLATPMHVLTESHNKHVPSVPSNPAEESVCKYCGIIFRNVIECNAHSSQHIVHASLPDNSGRTTPQTNNITVLFKCLECNLMFKYISSLRLHFAIHLHGAQ
eukprot:TRINITY_DN6508_c0_g1_i2.p1 TRINITY_DN6508_c0_g1~~TRINITY_DN6508_c0_g1_i2.p1  ORF type:complete len:272 (-),score=48.95 TRINITY_DN6508_c0_g1_i2:135-950(-)